MTKQKIYIPVGGDMTIEKAFEIARKYKFTKDSDGVINLKEENNGKK